MDYFRFCILTLSFQCGILVYCISIFSLQPDSKFAVFYIAGQRVYKDRGGRSQNYGD